MASASANGLLNMYETQKMLGVSRQTLHNMLNRGELMPDHVIELGNQKRRYFYRNTIECLIATRTLSPVLSQE